MDAQATARIPRPFLNMPDHRRNNARHELIDILTIALFAVICGANGWVAVVEYAHSKLDWLKTFLKLPHGIPSHDTFGDVFARLEPDAFEKCFQEWMATLVDLSGGKLVAIDGKSLRHSFEQGWDKSGMAHMVSAFVQANSMVFAQVKTNGKGKELSAIDKLLGMLDLEGAVVSIDALGCQKEIARKIAEEGKADFVLQVKANQEDLHKKLKVTLDSAILEDFDQMSSDFYEAEVEADHGRIETRKVWVSWDVNLLGKDLQEQWPWVRSMVVSECKREMHNGTSSTERHYYISSLSRRTRAKAMAGYIRGHWSVENNLHWQLDVSFREDERRIRTGHGAENFSRLARIALNLLKSDKTAKVGIENKRLKCGWNNDYLIKVIAG